MYKIIIPNEFKVGFVKRKDTFSGLLGFMIYGNKDDGSFGQQHSYDNWRDKEIQEKKINNTFMPGFVLNKGRLNHYRFGASAKFRVFHPEGFEFEISLDNLSLILGYTTISSGEINLPCCIGWSGQHCYLIPQIDLSKEIEIIHRNVADIQKVSEEKREKRKKNSEGKPINKRSWIGGRIMETQSGERFIINKQVFSKRNEENPLNTNFLEARRQKGIFEIIKDRVNSPMVIYSLSNIYGEYKKEDPFIKIIEKEDLTEDEKNILNKYSLPTIIFEENFSLEKLSFTRDDFYELFKSFKTGMQGHYLDIMMKNNVVKKDGIVYVLHTRYKSGRNSFVSCKTKQVFKFKKNEYNGYVIQFTPIASLIDGEKDYPQEVFHISLDITANDLEEVLKENFEELSDEDLKVVNEKVMRVRNYD